MCKSRNGELESGVKENVEIKGWNSRNEMRMRVQGISVGMREIWVEIRKMWGIRMVMHGINVET